VLLSAAALLLTACNPLRTDPDPLGGGIEQTSARYSGPSPAWIEVVVRGAADHAVYALALVAEQDLAGPAIVRALAPAAPSWPAR